MIFLLTQVVFLKIKQDGPICLISIIVFLTPGEEHKAKGRIKTIAMVHKKFIAAGITLSALVFHIAPSPGRFINT